MANEQGMTREDFMRLAEAYGFEVDDTRMDQLYAFVQGILATIRPIHDLDLGEVEPAMVFIPPKE